MVKQINRISYVCGDITIGLSGEDFIENQQKKNQLNSYIQKLGGIDIRLWRVKKE